MFPDDAQVRAVAAHIFDPFEYLMLRHAAGLLRTDFKAALGKVSYHVPCHLRVQNIGLKTRDVLKLVPGHHGGCHRALLGPRRHLRGEAGIPRRLGEDRPPGGDAGAECGADHYASDCPMAGHQIESGLEAMRGRPSTPEAAAPGLRNLKDGGRMNKLTVERSHVSLEQYARERTAFRARVLRAQERSGSWRSGRTSPGASRTASPCSTRCRRCCAPSASSSPRASPRSWPPTTR